MFWRLLNPIRHLRLERENERFRQQRKLDAVDVGHFLDVVGRQVRPGTDADALRRAIAAGNAVAIVRLHLVAVLRDLQCGRHDLARQELESITGLVEQQREAS